MVRLNQFRLAHFPRLISWLDTPKKLEQFASSRFVFPLTTAQLTTSINDGNRIAFYLTETETGICFGHAEIFLTRNSVRLEHLLIGDPLMRGTGLGLEMVQRLVEYSFDTLDQVLVESTISEENINAIRCFEMAGFTLNDAKLSEFEKEGKIWKMLNMTLDKKTWELQNQL